MTKAMIEGFSQLTPECILSAAEKFGFRATGEFSQLNSYENRVFEVTVEEAPYKIIGKFYRPGRWSKEAIQEEHDFLEELKGEGIEVVSPFYTPDSLLLHENYLTAFFPKQRGRLPQEFTLEDLKSLGRVLARLHNVGSKKPALHRPRLTADHYRKFLKLVEKIKSPEINNRHNKAADTIIKYWQQVCQPTQYVRLHGDCHRGNILHSDQGFYFIDFDDFAMGPEIQDFWMLLSGDNIEEEKEALLSGYEDLRDFHEEQWNWIPALRGLRMIYYEGWIAQRWEDPSFKKLFPDFLSYRYWVEETEALEKIAWKLCGS